VGREGGPVRDQVTLDGSQQIPQTLAPVQ